MYSSYLVSLLKGVCQRTLPPFLTLDYGIAERPYRNAIMLESFNHYDLISAYM